MRRIATTIQITEKENGEIGKLKEALHLPNKKAVVLEGVRSLWKQVEERKRWERLQSASRKVRRISMKVNREWARHGTATKVR